MKPLITDSSMYISQIRSEIERKQKNGMKYVYRIDERITKQVLNDLFVWLDKHKISYEHKKCARCKSTYEFIIRVPLEPLTD